MESKDLNSYALMAIGTNISKKLKEKEFKIIYFYCKKIGHLKNKCWALYRKLKAKPSLKSN